MLKLIYRRHMQISAGSRYFHDIHWNRCKMFKVYTTISEPLHLLVCFNFSIWTVTVQVLSGWSFLRKPISLRIANGSISLNLNRKTGIPSSPTWTATPHWRDAPQVRYFSLKPAHLRTHCNGNKNHNNKINSTFCFTFVLLYSCVILFPFSALDSYINSLNRTTVVLFVTAATAASKKCNIRPQTSIPIL